MPPPAKFWFPHENLDVYREAIAFVAWVSSLLEELVRAGGVKDQLDRASTSIALNIAEGNGKYALKDRCRFFDIAHGSSLECAAGLDILVAKAKLTTEQIEPGTVMVLDEEGALEPSQRAYDKRIAGVISGAGRRPGKRPEKALTAMPTSSDSETFSITGAYALSSN